MNRLEANIDEMSRLASEAGVKLRPHTKVHECPEIARMQVAAGACGIEVGTVDRAEVMVEAGIRDIIIAHPFYGELKMDCFKRILLKPGVNVAVLTDMIDQAKDISELGERLGKKVPILLKINTGGNRFGVLPGEPALDLARNMRGLRGIELIGIYAHESGGKPTPEDVERSAYESATAVSETARRLRQDGFRIEHVSVGASPTFRATCRYIREGKFPEITEIHPGQCVIGDIWHVLSLGNKREACAVTILAAVMSTAQPDYAVIDAGYKAFGNDSLIAYQTMPGFFWKGRPSFGSVQGRPDLWLGRLSAETATLSYMDPDMDPSKRLRLGGRIEIVPNNSTLVISLHHKIYGVRNGGIEREFTITRKE
jgi:D-serine deaminase-like pyridoxal phosphate-dependent protein